MKILLAFFGIMCTMMGIIVIPSDTDPETRKIGILFLIFGIFLIYMAVRTGKSKKNKEADQKSSFEMSGSQYTKLKNEYDLLKLQYTKLQNEYQGLLDSADNEKYKQQKIKIQQDIADTLKELQEIEMQSVIKQYDFSEYDTLTSEGCKNELSVMKAKEKELINSKICFVVTDSDGTKSQISNNIKQIVRCFNAECDNVLLNMSAKSIDASRNKINRSFESLNNLFKTDGIFMTDDLLQLKLKELDLVYTYELKKEQEKEQQRAIKEQMIEEEKVRREIERQKAKIEKDQSQCSNEVKRLMTYMQKTQNDAEKQLYIDKIKELEEKLKQLESDKESVLEREANARAGYVYIISNIGSFGENVYKIGMTRRLEPMDRVKELGSASVPFEFDVHAMIFSDDAPALETALHQKFEKRSVNRVNLRKEFFRVSLDEIESVVKEKYNNTVNFVRIPVAKEYNETLEILKKEKMIETASSMD